MNIVQEFSRFANQYDSHNSVQSQVAKKLVSMIDKGDYHRIVDIGCGSGSIYKNLIESNISFEKFTALDLSKEMLDIHPSSFKIEKLCLDFNNPKSFEQLKKREYDFLVSSSALQWSMDLDMTLKEISQLSKSCYLSFFTDSTFATLHRVAGVKSPIYSEKSIKSMLKRYYNCSFETVEYRLSFESVHQMFKYIKRSGVSGGDRKLSYKQTKEVIKNYPLDYLEFEVLFVVGSVKTDHQLLWKRRL
ncbi:methyltransferase domain-containing protein [Sulfurovum sp. bin170]|uniref:methyltransferase n=1 Tax=Sulfurovum sp. bin170 TaxID=2695268 RepID=UPI0013DFAEF4|nr:methyltransferase [Sulfurovum sp. bin170]NEW60435.1 methyltransferase domain-containing protein [Sulfurovum sp. bin170]